MAYTKIVSALRDHVIVLIVLYKFDRKEYCAWKSNPYNAEIFFV